MNHTLQIILAVAAAWIVVAAALSVIIGKFIKGAADIAEQDAPSLLPLAADDPRPSSIITDDRRP